MTDKYKDKDKDNDNDNDNDKDKDQDRDQDRPPPNTSIRMEQGRFGQASVCVLVPRGEKKIKTF